MWCARNSKTRGVVDSVAASLGLAPKVVASTEDLIVHLWVAGRELAEADLALPTIDAAADTGGAAAAAADSGAAGSAGSVGGAGVGRSSGSGGGPQLHVTRLLDSLASKLVARLVRDAKDLPSALDQLKRELPSKLDRVQVRRIRHNFLGAKSS